MDGDKNSASPAINLMKGPGAAGVASDRLPDIAIEIERLCGAVRAAADQLAFDDEPSLFAATLDNKAR